MDSVTGHTSTGMGPEGHITARDQISSETSSANTLNSEVEEFSSFEISQDESVHRSSSPNSNLDSKGKDGDHAGSFEEGHLEDQKSSDNIPHMEPTNGNLAVMSTPKASKLQDRPLEQKYGESNNSLGKAKTSQNDTKPSSRMSSDTFETPKTVETRTSTMTSAHQLDFPKLMHNELLFSGATRQAIFKDVVPSNEKPTPTSMSNPVRSPKKRLSRQSNYDGDHEFDYNSSFNNQSFEKMFSKLSLNDTDPEFIPEKKNLMPSSEEIVDLHNQLTNCKIQIKLQNDLLRDKIFHTFGNNSSKQELSEEIERQIMNSINSAKYKFQFEKANFEYETIKTKYDELVQENGDLRESLEKLNCQLSEQSHNRSNWESKLRKIIENIRASAKMTTETQIQNSDDLLARFEAYSTFLLDENLKLKRNTDLFAKELEDFKTYAEKLSHNLDNNTQKSDLLENKLNNKIQTLEELNFKFQSKIFDMETILKTERSKYSELQSAFQKLAQQLKQLKEKENKSNSNRLGLKEKLDHYETLLNDSTGENLRLQESNRSNLEKLEKIRASTISFHLIILDLLNRILDPVSTGNIINACQRVRNSLDFDDILKFLSVAYNFEVESISTILDNYEKSLKQSSSSNHQVEVISQLKSQNLFLTKKVEALENSRELETIRISELESQNAQLTETANAKCQNGDRLQQHRLDDLTNKWKTAEEALSLTEKGAKLKILQLEEEIRMLRVKLANK